MLVILSILVVLAAGLYILAPHPPAGPKQAAGAADLAAYLDRLVQSGSPPGLSAVVVKEGRLAWSGSFGYADQPRGRKATEETVYHWWSMTKIATAIGVMQLREQGKLGLDEPVTRYLPWFATVPSSRDSRAQKSAAETGPAITIRHLLQHSSGLPDTIPAMIGWVHYDDDVRVQTAVLREHFPKFNKLRFTPGSRAAYSNLNFMVLGAVIESITGTGYEAYVSEHILRPLGMSRTGFVYAPAMAEHEAAGTLPFVHMYTPLLPFLLDARALVREARGRLFWLRRVYIDATPSTGLIGPAPDVARLMLAYLGGGSLDGIRILQPQSVSLLSETPAVDGHGLGWFVGTDNGERVLEHAGGGPGFASIMRLYPDRGVGVAILANGTDLDRERLVGLLARVK